MTAIRTRIRIRSDGTFSGQAHAFPPGEHDAEITLMGAQAPTNLNTATALLTRVRAIQAELAKLPVRDTRTPDDILGYNERGLFD